MQVQEQEYFDLFNINKKQDEEVIENKGEEFEEEQLDLFSQEKKEEDEEKKEDENKENKQDEEVDILAQKSSGGRKPKYDFSDLSGYFSDRIKNGVLSGLVDDEGKDLELKTPEDFDSLLEANIEYKVKEKEKELEKTWYSTKSNAWKFVAQYAEIVDDPSKLIPVLQGVQNIQNISEIDASTIDGAERLVRYRMSMAGDDDDIIDQQVEALKQTDKLISTAEKYKPALLQYEQKRLAEIKQKEEEESKLYMQALEKNYTAAYSEIDKPFFGDKMKNEDKAVIFDMIGMPNKDLGGYPVFSAIDELYEKGDFETLRMIGYLLVNKESFLKSIQKGASSETAKNLQKKLRVELEKSNSSSGKDDEFEEEVKNKIRVNQLNKKPRFGQ